MDMRGNFLCLREVDLLFRPFVHRKICLPTRITMAPLARGLARGGVPGLDMLRYYQQRAAADVGLIVTEPVAVNDPSAADDAGMPHFYGGAALREWKRICRAVQATGCRMAPQLSHAGMLRLADGCGPSGVDPLTLEKRGEPMSRERMRAVVLAFAQAAADARLLGFDAVEINGARSGLLEQFLRASTNLRHDEYGGDLVRRTRFVCEVLHAVRKAVGRSFPLMFRFSLSGRGGDESQLVASPAELETLLQPLCEAGVDIFACTVQDLRRPAFAGSALNLAGWVKMLTRRPVVCEGGVGLPGAELSRLVQLVQAQQLDLLSVGRALHADAGWAASVRLGRKTRDA